MSATTSLQVQASSIARPTRSWPHAVWLAAGTTTVVALVATLPFSHGVAHRTTGDLTVLIRFMAGMKAMLALGLIALSAWRLGFPAAPRIAAAYLVACALMPPGAILIWQLTHLVAGAALFHAGFLLILATLWLDRECLPVPKYLRKYG